MENIPTVYQLDRNAVIEIELVLNTGHSSRISELKSIDIEGNIISPLLSVTEGHIQEKRNEKSFQQAFQRETEALDKFFQHARTDTLSLKALSNLSSAFIHEVISRQDADIDFVKKVQKAFAKQTSRDFAKAEYKKAKSLINDNGRSLTDKISIACLAVALGSDQARGVIKPNIEPDDSHAYNAFADLEKISMISYMRVLSITIGKASKIELFSFDEDLMNYYSLVKPESASIKSIQPHHEFNYAMPLDPLLESMLHLKGKKKLRAIVKAELEQLEQ